MPAKHWRQEVWERVTARYILEIIAMPRIRCHYVDCVFLDDGFCSAAAVEVDPDMGCMTFSRADDLVDVEDDLDFDELDEWDEMEDDEDLWLDEDDDF